MFNRLKAALGKSDEMSEQNDMVEALQQRLQDEAILPAVQPEVQPPVDDTIEKAAEPESPSSLDSLDGASLMDQLDPESQQKLMELVQALQKSSIV